MFDYSGFFAPIVTPFTDDGNQLSEVRLARMVQRLIQIGTAGFVVNTDIGEFTSTSFSERKAVLEQVIRETRNALPVVAHITTLNTGASLDLGQHAERHGARGAVIMPPYYGELNDAEIVHHFRTIARYCNLPFLLVDPLGRMNSGIREALLDAGNFVYAEPIVGGMVAYKTRREVATYEWQIGEVVCSPLSAIWGNLESLPSSVASQWGTTFGDLGALRVVKAAYEALDCSVGEARAPFRGLSVAQIAVVNALVRMSEQEKTAEDPSAA